MDVRTLAVVARAGIEALKFQKKKRAAAEEKARLEKEAAAKAEAEAARVAAAKAQAEAEQAAEAEAKAQAEAEQTAEAEAQAEQTVDTEAPPEPEAEAPSQAEQAAETETQSAQVEEDKAHPEPIAEVKSPSKPKAKAEAKAKPTPTKAKAATQRAARRVRQRHPGVTMGFTIKSVLSGIIFLALFSVYLVIEVIASMAVYMYLNLNHVETFGYMVSLSYKAFGFLTDYLKQIYPQLHDRAFATILGEMGAKSILLLFIGLATSAVTRFLVWGTGVVLDGLKTRSTPPKPTAPPAAPAEAESSAA